MGEESDARTDIFTLGAVPYEMLTGARASQGKHAVSIPDLLRRQQISAGGVWYGIWLLESP